MALFILFRYDFYYCVSFTLLICLSFGFACAFSFDAGTLLDLVVCAHKMLVVLVVFSIFRTRVCNGNSFLVLGNACLSNIVVSLVCVFFFPFV